MRTKEHAKEIEEGRKTGAMEGIIEIRKKCGMMEENKENRKGETEINMTAMKQRCRKA